MVHPTMSTKEDILKNVCVQTTLYTVEFDIGKNQIA